MKRTTLTALSAVALLLPATAVAQAPSYQSVLDGARKEGALTVWVSSPGRPESHAALFEAFNKRFGLAIKGEWSPAGSVQTGARLAAEGSGAKGSIDVVGAGGAEEVSVLLGRDLLKPYPWAEVFGKELPQIGTVAGWAMPDLKNIALPLFDATYGLAWNKDLIKDADVPGKMTDLVDPRWSGKVAVNAFFTIPFDITAHATGPDAMLAMVRKLLDNKPVLERGTPPVARAVAVGQVPLGVTTFHAAARAGTADKPLGFKLFSDYIPIIAAHLYVPETAPHPNAARLFTAWMVTEGMAVAEKSEMLPRAADASSPLGKLVKEAQAKGSKIVAAPSLAAVKQHEALRKKIADMMTGVAK
jgi:ABC-type Fe3+ transport system substrate-binding protein